MTTPPGSGTQSWFFCLLISFGLVLAESRMGVPPYSTGNCEQVPSEQSQFFHSLDVVWSQDLGEKPFLDRSQWEFSVLQWCVSRDHNVAHHGRTGRAHLTGSLRNRTPTKQLPLHRHPEGLASPSSFLPSTPGDFVRRQGCYLSPKLEVSLFWHGRSWRLRQNPGRVDRRCL